MQVCHCPGSWVEIVSKEPSPPSAKVMVLLSIPAGRWLRMIWATCEEVRENLNLSGQMRTLVMELLVVIKVVFK